MKASTNLRVTAEELRGSATVIDTYYNLVNEMWKAATGTEVALVDFSVIEKVKLALGMEVIQTSSVKVSGGAVVNWEYKVSKAAVEISVNIEAGMEVYAPLFAAYTDIINTYGSVLINTITDLRPLVVSALEIQEQTACRLKAATSILQAKHQILGGKQ